MDLTLTKCKDCQTYSVTEMHEEIVVPYGKEPCVELRVTVPVMQCGVCGNSWTDYRGEFLRDEAVRQYEAQLV
jgi:hypothetical protein